MSGDHDSAARRSTVLLILAAGYGTRLARDLEQDPDPRWDAVRRLPKPLLPVLRRPVTSSVVTPPGAEGAGSRDSSTSTLPEAEAPDPGRAAAAPRDSFCDAWVQAAVDCNRELNPTGVSWLAGRYHTANVGISQVVLVTNAAHLALYEAWAAGARERFALADCRDSDADASGHGPGSMTLSVISDGSTSNATRLGAIGSLGLAMGQLPRECDLLVVAGDSWVHRADGLDLAEFLRFRRAWHFAGRPADVGLLCYPLPALDDPTQRGILALSAEAAHFAGDPAGLPIHLDPAAGWAAAHEDPPPSAPGRGPVGRPFAGQAPPRRVLDLVEKPASAELAPSRFVCPAVYLLTRDARPHVLDYIARGATDPTVNMDAPGHLISHLAKCSLALAFPIRRRMDVGNLAEYRAAIEQEHHAGRCFARAALAGNPSDAYAGRVVGAAVANYYAEVCIAERPEAELQHLRQVAGIALLPHSVHDSHEGVEFGSGMRLMEAAVGRFHALATRAGVSVAGRSVRGLGLSYSTTIPRSCGLSGSSALIAACWRALASLHRVSLATLCGGEEQIPFEILAVETEDLGIVAGPQDRLIQHHGGLVVMDFAGARPLITRPAGCPKGMLPGTLYLAHRTEPAGAGSSGDAHRTVRARHTSGSTLVRDRMARLADLAQRAVDALAKVRDARGGWWACHAGWRIRPRHSMNLHFAGARKSARPPGRGTSGRGPRKGTQR
ncbi:hypothetical protein, variant [Fonticula alba]|uniref:GHMP kinase N-terminal domain-containing protein n=1 Tax=Fonticula alba TaxID=691883 RepID=A0A058ZFH5_FONAL|nr:hypothetical protein, variant [Fonticula alba]KCV73140.1 hypothetical protein, variant [Fonticula alba]|eukprot:XP_009492841.1 hypothetical protein, variant [Fonticula alba]